MRTFHTQHVGIFPTWAPERIRGLQLDPQSNLSVRQLKPLPTSFRPHKRNPPSSQGPTLSTTFCRRPTSQPIPLTIVRSQPDLWSPVDTQRYMFPTAQRSPHSNADLSIFSLIHDFTLKPKVSFILSPASHLPTEPQNLINILRSNKSRFQRLAAV